MATATFTRFVPKIAAPNPHVRQPSLHTVKTLYGEQDEHEPLPSGVSLKKMDEHFPKIENKSAAAASDFYRQTRQKSRSPSLDTFPIGTAVSKFSPIDGATPSPSVSKAPKGLTSMTSLPPPPAPSIRSTSHSIEPRSDRSGSATLVQATSTAAAVPSPVVPIRSMFPTYNPTVPLSQQSYYPQRPSAARLSRNISSDDRRYSQLTVDRELGVRTAPASVVNFPTDAMSISEPQFSSHRELEKLWDASHGAEPSRLIKSFDLEMSR